MIVLYSQLRCCYLYIGLDIILCIGKPMYVFVKDINLLCVFFWRVCAIACLILVNARPWLLRHRQRCWCCECLRV